MEIAVDLFDLGELKKFISIDAVLESTQKSWSFEAIWATVEEKFNESDQAKMMKEILDSEDYLRFSKCY